jgi:diguanylate cyclase (GGDEF)-like protein
MNESIVKMIMNPLQRLSQFFSDEETDDDLLRHLVSTLYLDREPLFASIVIGALVTGLAWAMTHEAIFIAYSIANALIGAARLYLLRSYKRNFSDNDDRATTLSYDSAFAFWSTLYAIVLGLACYSLIVAPSVGAQPLALGACAGFSIAYVARSSGRMRLLLLQVVATNLPMLTACLTRPVANGGGYALAVCALIIVTIGLGRVANGKIVELYQANKENLRMARCDMLTGLQNRFAFSDALRGSLLRAKERRGERFAVITIDLDRFKDINDTLGHMVGDAVLVEMAARLTKIARAEDTVARLGGDEFVVIARGEGFDATMALGIAKRIVDALSQPFQLAPSPLAPSASVGVAIYPEHGASGEELLKNADIALYEAKGAGRNQAQLFDAAMQTKVDDGKQLETEIQTALATDQFEAWFQPIQNIEDGEIVGYEALARWRHPLHGSIPPDRFMPCAAQNGAIVAIGERVLEKACTAAAAWPAHLTVAINLSPGQFRNPKRLVEAIKTTLLKTGLAPSRLYIEISESLMLEDTAATREAIAELASYGVRFSLDDFGAGYSSLSYIQSYPFSEVKIDRKFVANVDTDKTAVAIIAAVCELAGRLGLAVVAEGVETRVQHAALRKLGLTLAQGYLYGYPAPQIVAPKRLQLIVSR